jgi:hypothetical protein
MEPKEIAGHQVEIYQPILRKINQKYGALSSNSPTLAAGSLHSEKIVLFPMHILGILIHGIISMYLFGDTIRI